MGRKKIQIARLPSESQRRTTYNKRGKGIIKKASEISVLCDIDVLLIMFSTTGRLDYFSSNPSIGKILQRFIHEATKMPKNETKSVQDSQEIKREIIDDDIQLMLLELQERMLDPGMKAFHSQQEFQDLMQGLYNIRVMIANRETESQQTICNDQYYDSSQSTQMQMLMQQPQAGLEARMLDTPLDGEHMQQQEVLVYGTEDPSLYTDMQWRTQMPQLQAVPETGMEDPSSFSGLLGNIPMELPQVAPQSGMCGPLQGDEHRQQPGMQEHGMNNQSLSSAPLFSAQENVYNHIYAQPK